MYSFKDGRLLLQAKNGVQFDISMRGKLVCVTGNSATCKTYLANLVDLFNLTPQGMVIDSIAQVLNYKSSSDYIAGIINNVHPGSPRLYIVDNADIVFEKEPGFLAFLKRRPLRDYYLVYSRCTDLEISPNYYGTLVMEGQRIRLEYMAEIKGWF